MAAFRGDARSWTFLRLGRDERALDLLPLCSKRLRGGVERCLIADESFLSKSRKRLLRSVRLGVLDRGDHRKARRARLAEAASASSSASSLTSRSCRSRARSPRRPCPTHGRAERRCSSVKRAEEDVNVPRVAPASSSRTLVHSAASGTLPAQRDRPTRGCPN